MVKSTALNDAEAIKHNLKAFEGDKKAALEGQNSKIEENKQIIVNLREENKTLVAKIRELKNQPKLKHGSGLGPRAIEQLDQKVCSQIKKFNAVRATAEAKEKEIANLMMQLNDVALDESYFKQNKNGKLPESQRIMNLETQVEKAASKFADAKVMTNTYLTIISKLEEDRQEFDNALMNSESMIQALRVEKEDLKALCATATASRDAAKAELSKAEAEAHADRAQRESTKRELQAAAEEQRLKYEAMERRLRLSSHGDRKPKTGDDAAKKEIEQQLQSSEDMMRRIQEATGVMDIQEVLSRFRSQNDTEKKLTALKEENTATLATLKEKLKLLEKQYEAQKYSGEARNTSNQRMVAEFEQYLTAAQTAVEKAQKEVSRNESLIVKVQTGVDHLYDKLDTIKAVKFRAASTMNDKLTESKLRLEALQTELEQRKGELESAQGSVAPLILPLNNTRINFEDDKQEGKKEDDDEDANDNNEAISRAEVKRRAQLIADANVSTDPRKRK